MDFAKIFDILPDAVCIVDVHGGIIISNDNFRRSIMDFSAPVNFVTDILHQHHQEIYSTAVEQMQSDVLIDGGLCKPLGPLKTLTMSDNSQQFPMYRIVHWSISSFDSDKFLLSGRDSSDSDRGHKFGSITSACMTDIAGTPSDRKKCDYPFEDMTTELIDFFQRAPIALHWLSGTGVIMWANDTELQSLGYSAEEYIGHNIGEFLMPGEDVHLQEVFGNLAAGRTIHDAPFRFRAKNGDVKYLIVDSNVNFNEDGSFRHTRCFIRNDTDRRVKEEILLASNRIMQKEADAKSTFIRHVFHEMRTPLHVLSTFLSSSNPSDEDFEEMRHHTDSTLAMVDDLTFATTFEAGKTSPLTPLPVHLPTLLKETIDAVNAVEQRGGRAVEIRLRLVGTTPESENRMADPCLSRVIYNLLSNAVRYSPATGVHVDFTVTYTSDNTADYLSGVSLGSKRSRYPSSEGISKYTKNDDVRTNSSESCGSFTFSITNTTVAPMDLTLVRNYFSYYYHFDSVIPEDIPTSSMQEDENLGVAVQIFSPADPFNPTPLAASASVASSFSRHVEAPRGRGSRVYKDLKSVKGLGLGLFTAFSMVNLMGGQLECSAESSNEASFWFSLSLRPCLTAFPSSPRQPRVIDVMAEPLITSCSDAVTVLSFDSPKLMRVLVVDDSSMCQKVIVRSLKGLEFETDVASNGWEACEKLQEIPCKFDAVLMDLRMPVMDGLEATRYCREVLKLQLLPIIAITAEIGFSIREEALKAGASHFLNKPAKAQEIIAVLRSLVL